MSAGNQMALMSGEAMVVGGSYEPLADKVFRIGRMGVQADLALLQRGMNTLAEALNDVGL